MGEYWRVVVRYSDWRGGVWHGPAEDRASAEKRLATEQARVRGSAWIEETTAPILPTCRICGEGGHSWHRCSND